MTRALSATKDTAPNAVHARSKDSSRNGRYCASACTSGTSMPVASRTVDRVAQHAGGQVERDRVRAVRRQPARAHRRSAADLEHPPAGDVAEQVRVVLAQVLRAPHEVRDAEERAVLGVVVVGVAVPRRAVGAHGGRGRRRSPADADRAADGLNGFRHDDPRQLPADLRAPVDPSQRYGAAMALPLRTKVFWSIYRLVERDPVMQQSADKVRAASDARIRMSRLPGMWLLLGRPDRDATIERVRGAHSPTAPSLPLRVYRPRVRDTDATADPLPVVVNFHGGGWVSGDPQQSEWWCSAVAARAGVVVVSVDYRLAPEHPFPVPAEDCYAATAWVAEHAAELGVDAARLAVMGDSAGGNLAAVVALMARDRGGPAIALQVLIYPSVDLGADFPSKDENAHAPVLTRKDVDTTWRLYVQGDADPAHPYASPLHAEHHDLPPALIQTAQFDPLRDQGPAYAAALRAAGVSVRLTNYVQAVHGFISLPHVTVGVTQALAEVVATIGETLGAGVPAAPGQERAGHS